jgi:hypothetical protein
MENELDNATEIIDNLKKVLTKLDLTLENFYDDDLTQFEKEIFIDCKLYQQEALRYAYDLSKILNS